VDAGPPISPHHLAEVLPALLVRELRTWRDALAEEQIRAFDLGCFPWHGYLELSFLTTREPNIPQSVDPFSRIAEWRFYNFGVRSHTSIRSAREGLGARMQRYWDVHGSAPAVSERFLQAAALVATHPEVSSELRLFPLAGDFQTTVFDPGHSTRGNLINGHA
jgi:hypothetical protein